MAADIYRSDPGDHPLRRDLRIVPEVLHQGHVDRSRERMSTASQSWSEPQRRALFSADSWPARAVLVIFQIMLTSISSLLATAPLIVFELLVGRSEERRVGREGRAGGWRVHEEM